MNVTETARKLREAQGNPQALALATLDVVLASHEPRMREVIEAAAIPHWFTVATLATILQVTESAAAEYVGRLECFPMVEPFPRGAWNIHEATRLALRARMARQTPQRFRALSSLAARAYGGVDPRSRIEALYHRLISDPVAASVELGSLCYRRQDSEGFEVRHDIAAVLRELLEEPHLPEESRAYALLYFGVVNRDRLSNGDIEKALRESLSILKSLQNDLAQAEAHGLLGDVLFRRGLRDEALREYKSSNRIRARLQKKGVEHPETDESVEPGQLGSASRTAETLLKIAQGKTYSLLRPVSVIEIYPAEDGRMRSGLITQLVEGDEIRVSGPGFSDRTICVRSSQKSYFLFIDDLERAIRLAEPPAGNIHVLRTSISAIRILPAGADGQRQRLGLITHLAAGAQIEISGPGFSDRTVSVRHAGESYFLFLDDLDAAIGFEAAGRLRESTRR